MKILNNEKGFTLVELLVSMLIFAIGVAALTQTLLATMRGNNLGNKETTAMTLAYHQMEELRGLDPNAFDLATGKLSTGTHTSATNVVPNIFGGTTVVTKPAGYSVSYTVTPIVPSGPGSLFYQSAKQVIITVGWIDPASHSVTLSSVIVPNI